MLNLISKCNDTNACSEFSCSLDNYKENDGFKALEKVLNEMAPEDVINELKEANLKGRGGAAFPTWLKWKIVSEEEADQKYVICNADEGEPGTFKDRVLLNGCPYSVIVGMIIAGYVSGADKGFAYIRGEYPESKVVFQNAIEDLREEGYLGENILGKDFNFDIEVRTGAGAYVCGEETALIESIEGNPGRSRFKPPYPPIKGLWGKPTLVNNVETLVNIPAIISIGAEVYKNYGTESSTGTKLMSVSGDVVNKGVYEIEFGTTIRELIFDVCGGISDGKEIKFVQLGGSSGPCLSKDMLDLKLDFDELRKEGFGLGSGALFVADESKSVMDFMKATMEFFSHESCGKCTPCREGNRQILKILNKIIEGNGTEEDLELLKKLGNVVKDTSLCGFGQAAPTALLTTLEYFEDEYMECIKGEGVLNG